MEDLRNRFRRLLSIHTDALRHLEHGTFNRLLYRNRQQHRHGLYFRRLEHVRRLLRNISSHVVWDSVQHALGEEDDKPRSKRRPPLALSTVTLEDLRSVEALLKKLVGLVIPATAVRVTTELICRQHFIPFAVAIVACLARLFVIERKLVAEVRGALVESKLLLGISEAELGPQQQRMTEGRDVEDIGEEVESTAVGIHIADNLEDKPENDSVGIMSETPGKARIYERGNALSRPPKRQRVSTDRARSERTKTEAPSLYEVVAMYSKGAVSASKSTTTSIGGSLTSPAREIPGGRSNKNLYNGLIRSEIKSETPEAEEKATVADTVRSKSQNGLDLKGGDFEGIPPTPRAGIQPKHKADIRISGGSYLTFNSTKSSDSEDIEDIFGALEN